MGSGAPRIEPCAEPVVGRGFASPLELRIGAAGGACIIHASPCPGQAGPSEDAFLVLPTGPGSALLAVADGMGGLPGGGRAAELAVSLLAEVLADCPEPPIRPLILDAIERANEAILASGSGGATTLAVAEIGAGFVRPYHVGDSEIMLFGQRGAHKLQTVPHSPVGFAVEAGVLDRRQAMSHSDRHLVSNVVGSREMRIEVGSPVRLAPRDTLVLCSDGLVDNLHHDEIREGLRIGRLDQALARVVATARRRMEAPGAGEPGKPDDLTVMAFRLAPGRGVPPPPG